MDSSSIWYIIAGILMLAEAFTPRLFIFICLAVSSLCTALIDQFSNSNFTLLALIFIATTTLLIFTLRPALKFIIKVPKDKNADDEELIGKEAMVFKPISENELGTIKVYDFDAVLLAKSLKGEFIGQGTTVKIIQKDGDIAIVECLE